MTYGCAKSDSAILAGKPTNKAEQSAAESVKRRVQAKANTGQQSTYRAQDRESVSQALDRIRQVARHRKKEKRPMLCFNYRSPLNELWDPPALKARYDYRTEYPPEGRAGLRVVL